jgi:hypothetical protein
LNVSAAAGSSVPSQNVTISRSGGGALRWSINSLVNWVQVSPVKGTDSGAVTVNFGTNRPTSSGTYPIFTVKSQSQSATVSVNLTVVGGAPVVPSLVVTCPADISVTSPDGSGVVVNYPAATTSGGVAPVSVTGSPASGSLFPVGPPTSVTVTARSSDNQTATCGFSVTVTSTGGGSTTWTVCANEGGTCAFTGTQQVRYGANGLYAYRTLTGGTACNNSVFGDPAPGVQKQCQTATSSTTSWSLCASESGYCAFAGTQQVRYGANGLYAYRTVTDGTACSNSVFGDPAPGMAKQCEMVTTSSTSLSASAGSTSSFGP